jgi:hypothetical protein
MGPLRHDWVQVGVVVLMREWRIVMLNCVEQLETPANFSMRWLSDEDTEFLLIRDTDHRFETNSSQALRSFSFCFFAFLPFYFCTLGISLGTPRPRKAPLMNHCSVGNRALF